MYIQSQRLCPLLQQSNCNNLCILRLYSPLLLVGNSHAAPQLFGTVFPYLYALVTVSLVLGLSSRLLCLQDIVAGPMSTPLTPLQESGILGG